MYKKRLLDSIKPKLKPWLISAIVLLVGLTITTTLWWEAKKNHTENLNAALNYAADQTQNNIRARLHAYETVMRGVKGLIDGSDIVTVTEFRSYIDALKLKEKESGVLGIGLVTIVLGNDKDRHLENIRKLGLSDYKIKPEGDRQLYAPIIRMEPMVGDNLKALGLDLLAVPFARAAMERARDTNEVVISNHFTLAQDEGKPSVFSFVMYLPIFKSGANLDTLNARRINITGWVDVPFRINDLMAGLKGEFDQDVGLEIYDGNAISDQSRMYSSTKLAKYSHAEGMLQTKRQLDFAGHTWTLLLNTTPEFESRVSNLNQSKTIAGAGLALSLMLALLSWVLVKGQQVAENRYLKLFKQSGFGILMLNREQRILEANPAALTMLGYRHEELLSFHLPSILLDTEKSRLNRVLESLMAGESHTEEWAHVRKDGTTFIAEVNARQLDSQTYFAILHDLTNRKKNEQRIVRLNNLYEALSETNQAIVRMSDENDLFPLVCKCAVKFGGMQMAWVGVLDEPTQLIIPVSTYGDGLEFLDSLLISSRADIQEGQGPCGIAFRENHYVVVNNFLEDTLTQPWRDYSLQFGWNASGHFPIARNGKPYAMFIVYSPEVDAFDKETIALLSEMSSDISFALDNFDREAQRRLAHDKLQIAQLEAAESRDRYRDLYEFAPIGYLSISKQGMITQVNWKVTSMLGVKRSELYQQYFSEFVVDEEKTRWQSLFLSMQEIDGGEELNFDIKLTHVSGAIATANLNCLRMDDEVDQPILRIAMFDVTQLKHTEEEKQRSDVRLQATIDAIPDLLFEIDIYGRYFSAHSPSEQLLPIPSEDLIGKTVHDVMPESTANVVMSAIYEADVAGRSQGKQFELVLPEGQFWFELSVAKKPKAAGEDIRFILLSRDVTERKQSELKLIESSASLAKAQASAHLGSWELDLASMIGSWSDENFRLYHLEPEQGTPSFDEFLELIHPDDRNSVVDVQRQIATHIGSINFETRTNPSLGSMRTLSNSIKVIRDADGSAIRAMGTTLDITDRKLVELEYRIAATAFESQEGMMVTDANKIILKVNKAFTKISGYTFEEAVGKTPRLLSSGHHHDDFHDSMWENIAVSGYWEGEVWNRRKNGEVYPQHLTITAVVGDNGVVTNYVATFTDVTLRNAAEAEINHLAFYDVLTRLPNRRLLIDRLNHALSNGARLGWSGALLFLDLDHFKTLNDTLGHDVGDLLLRQVADRLTECVREGDTVARLGGDEFVVMLEDLSNHPLEAASQAETIANKILISISRPYQLGLSTYQTSASIGIVLFSENEHGQDVLLKHADIAMYQAKKMGRNTLCFFDPNMQEAINLRASLEVDLRKALDDKQFELYYQVQVDHLGKALGAEALIRWIHPERGLISPLEFIPLAEETGLILPIGQWVLEAACAQLKAWQITRQTQDLTLSINVSAKQFYQGTFADQVQAAVKDSGINPMQLKLELTESIMLENIEATITKMMELKNIGINFSLDDFGTGYSSLQYLKSLPLYQLKIDRSFVREIAFDTSDQAIVRTVIAIAETLNLDVIAEGVETEEQRQILMNCGCNAYQGFLFGRPVPIAQFNLALKP
ncbi:MAG: EAL domain-containing protein [Methylotenera sp.]|uniref:EAL domain-containing protein n=1 Tax=Methylotenera sp. TaxID=2051956 RepID=UPI00248A5287|nr:EAL domain-containing protein [Methylotenera sp.]MDI1309536.1 EAL domain-containing protein [Methylotenera sp.]